MDASIGEPFLLASYGAAQRFQKSKATGKSNANVYATHEKIASGSSDGYATVTAQGDGVHVLDLSTLHPVISHTLGPSTSFSCASVTVGFKGQQNVCATYAAIASSADVNSEDCGRTLWMWRENLSSIGDRASQKKRAVMPHYISEIHACNGRLLVLSPAGDVTVVDENLEIQSTRPPPPSTVSILRAFAFPRESSSFLPSSMALVLLEHSQESTTTTLRVLGILGEDEAREIGSTQIAVKSDDIASVSCSSSGYLSVLAKDGSWHSFQIDSKNDTVSVYSATQPLRLRSLSFIGKRDETSVLAVNTSHVLLAAITSPTRNIVLLLWDLQYSVLLASHILAIPSTLSHLPKLSMSLRPAAAASAQALLILYPPTDTQAKSATRSSILVVPMTVPAMSTIANAMGRAPAGAQWLVQASPSDTLGPGRAKVLAAVQTAMSKNEPQAAEKAFFDWEKRERSPIEDQTEEKQVELGHSFVRDLLTAVLPPAQPLSNPPYSSALVRFLLERRVVSASMVGGGILAALKLRGDWAAIQLCTTHVIDLAESDWMFILQCVVDHSRKTDATDAMEVDPPALGAIPKLPAFLDACVRYQTSPPSLRAAMHQHLPQPEDVVAVLEVSEGWVGAWKSAEVIALPPKKSVVQNEHGVTVLKDGWRHGGAGTPPLIKVLSFIQTVLDASFLALLQHTPAHRILRKVLARIEPEIQLTEQVELLRGPLELFARAQAKAVRDGKEGKKDQGDWRQRRRLAHERSAMAAGAVYQLNELVL
ncbi:hypothetical protein DFH07DRAFT_857014 [Mycena maculata]|uniref:Uncharacterized protein n=1 Tax=Mycena maculata TaxID=230809 RepID=A0AAD7MM09_9AGAR|nr:hypothetical protein DFH07DRAFT_857014 [Mycena maculata]